MKPLCTGFGQYDTHSITLSSGKQNTAARAGQPYTGVTEADILAMVQDPPSIHKDDAQWFIPSDYLAPDAREHEAQRLHGQFWTIPLDLDANSPPLAVVRAALTGVLGNAARAIYSSRSAKPDNLKWRALCWLETPIAGADYADTVEAFNDLIADQLEPDRALQRTGQLIFLPNRGEYYESEVHDGPRISLTPNHPIIVRRDQTRRSRADAEAKAAAWKARKAALTPSDATNMVDAFNESHTVSDLLDRYGYEQARDSDNWKSPMQSGGSFATRDYGDYWISLSGSDGAAGIGQDTKTGQRHGDAFDLFVHFEHAGDFNVAVRTFGALHRLTNMPGPSHVPAGMMPTALGQGMPSAPRAASVVDLICARIKENPTIAVALLAEEVARLSPADRDTVLAECKPHGIKMEMQAAVKRAVADSRKAAMELRGLIADKNGGPVPNMTNIKRVLCSEEGWRGTFAKSLFDDAVWLRRPDTRQLTDDDVLKVMEVMQSDLFPSIGVETVRHGVQAAAAGNTFHPVREYLESLQWDGVGRAMTLFTAYFPCASEDPQYLRAVGEKFLIGAVARVMQPGCKVDTMPVIAGNQGQKKSSGLAALVGDQWYGNDMPDMTQKDAKEWLRGKWMAEVGELSAMRGKDIEHVKNFLSTTSDSYRKSYGHVTQTYPRQTVFAGTVNGNEYLSDETGNRRFWPLQMIEGAFVDVEGLARDRGQLWAEALHMYRSGTAWWFDEGESATLSAQQAAARSVDIDETRVVEWLRGQEGPVTAGGVAATLFADAPGNKSLSMRVARYLQGAGWRVSKTVMGKKQWDRGRGAEPYVSPSCGGNVMPMTPRR